MILFHATYKALMPSIREHGLCRSRIWQKAWPDCSSEYIYLEQDANAAASYCEASDMAPAEWLDDIIVIAVDAELLDASLFTLDENITNAARLTSYQYNGDIPPSAFLAFLSGSHEKLLME